HLGALWSEGIWGKWIGAAWTAVGIVIALRDDFLSPELQAKSKAPVVAHLLSWQIWATTFLVIIIGWLFEASFRVHRRALSDSDVAKAEAGAAKAELAARLTPNMRIYVEGDGIRELPSQSASAKWVQFVVQGTMDAPLT